MQPPEEPSRRRKAHHKSRQGCGNCKLRRVKCDESKPRCEKCTSFGVDCDYETKASELEVSGVGSFQISLEKPQNVLTPPVSPRDMDKVIDSMKGKPLFLHVDNGSEDCGVIYIDTHHLNLMRKFHDRSVQTIGTAESIAVYREVLTKMASQHSFVMHAVLKFTLMHDRYLYDPITAKPSSAEAFHGYHAVALFSQKLSEPLEEEIKDAVWATAAILGAMSTASVDATTPYEAWPLKDPDFSDLDWLKMSKGKKEVWRLANPLRESSAFKTVIELEHSKREIQSPNAPRHPELDKLFPFVVQLYHLDSPQPQDNGQDPYHKPASILERLIPLQPTHSTIMWFLSFLGHMEPDFRHLLEEKDPSAIILLAWWYAKLIPYNGWWINRRAILECQAICLYLDKTLPSKHEVRRLLEFPRSVCGLDSKPSESERHRRPDADDRFPWPQNF